MLFPLLQIMVIVLLLWNNYWRTRMNTLCCCNYFSFHLLRSIRRHKWRWFSITSRVKLFHYESHESCISTYIYLSLVALRFSMLQKIWIKHVEEKLFVGFESDVQLFRYRLHELMRNSAHKKIGLYFLKNELKK